MIEEEEGMPRSILDIGMETVKNLLRLEEKVLRTQYLPDIYDWSFGGSSINTKLN